MLNIKSRFVKLFGSYLLILLPIFFIYFFISQNIISEIKEKTYDSYVQEINYILGELDKTYLSYSDTSVSLSTEAELRRYNMLKNEINAYLGIEILNNVKSYNADIYDLFMVFDNGKIYGSRGLTSENIYFKDTLKGTDNCITKAFSILKDKSNNIYYFEQTVGDGYFIYHYPIMWRKDEAIVSSNFVIPIKNITDLFDTLIINCDTYITYTLRNNEKLLFYGNATEKNTVNMLKNIDFNFNNDDFTAYTLSSSVTGSSLSVSYESSVLFNNVRKKQAFAYIAVFLLMVFSIYISFIVSKKYHNPLHTLASQIATNRMKYLESNENLADKDDEIEYLQKTFGVMMDERDQMYNGIEKYRLFLRMQTAQLLFNGMIKEENVANELLRQCEYEFHEEYYVVLGVCLSDGKERSSDKIFSQICEYFESDLFFFTYLRNRKILVALVGVPNPDYMFKNRNKIENSIRSLILDKGDAKIAISFSQIYENISMISHAYVEMVITMQEVLQKNIDSITAFFEKFQEEGKPLVITEDELDLQSFEKALADRDEEVALGFLQNFFYSREYNIYDANGKRYIRYILLQRVIHIVENDEEIQSADKILDEIIKINPSLEDDFIKKLKDITKKICFTKEKEDVIKVIIEYIDQNFSKYDLSLDEVASYAGLSKSYLSRLFKTKTGSRYIEYLSELRLAKAKQLLLETEMPIKTIVKHIGYYDVVSFRKKFKQKYGINASQLRKENID